MLTCCEYNQTELNFTLYNIKFRVYKISGPTFENQELMRCRSAIAVGEVSGPSLTKCLRADHPLTSAFQDRPEI